MAHLNAIGNEFFSICEKKIINILKYPGRLEFQLVGF
jgi:hypothetical protein